MDKRRRRGSLKKRLIIGSIIGILLASAGIWVSETIYDPFMGDVDDLKTLVPDDADWVIECADFPTFIKGLENGGFYGALNRNQGFHRYWSAPEMKNEEALKAVQTALEKLTDRSQELPGGLEILGDLSGTQIVIAGYDTPIGAPPRIFIALKPHAKTAIVGANVCISRRLYGWFVDGKIPVESATHDEGLVTFQVRVEQKIVPVTLTRVENALLIGTDEREVKRCALRAIQSVPIAPARYRPTEVWDGHGETSINILAKTDTFSKYADLRTRVLLPAFGPRQAGAVEAFFPHFEGADVYGKLRLDDILEVRLQTADCRSRRPIDGISAMRPIDREIVDREIEDILSKLPHYTFGYFHQNIAPGDLLAFLCNSPALFDYDKQRLWFETAIERVPRFKGIPLDGTRVPNLLPSLKKELSSAFEDRVSVFFFEQKREEIIEASQPGVAVCMRIKNRAHLVGLIDEISASIDPKIQAFERYEAPEWKMTLWHITAKGLVDDRSIAQPAFAIIGDWFVFTNWVRVLTDMQEVFANAGTGFGVRDELRQNLDELPTGAGGFLFVDMQQIFSYFDSAKEGWVKREASVNESDKIAMRATLLRQAIDQRIPPEQRDDFVNVRWNAWYNEATGRGRKDTAKRRIEAQLDYFRTAFQWGFLASGLDNGTLSVVMRMAAKDG
jgi:hypothetical protein